MIDLEEKKEIILALAKTMPSYGTVADAATVFQMTVDSATDKHHRPEAGSTLIPCQL